MIFKALLIRYVCDSDCSYAFAPFLMLPDKARVKGNAELRAAVMEDEVGFDQETTKVSAGLD
jgi:hypothetical protein